MFLLEHYIEVMIVTPVTYLLCLKPKFVYCCRDFFPMVSCSRPSLFHFLAVCNCAKRGPEMTDSEMQYPLFPDSVSHLHSLKFTSINPQCLWDLRFEI